MASYEEKRNAGYSDVYVYIYSPAESTVEARKKEASDYCVRHRYIPHFRIDNDDREELHNLLFKGKLEYKRVVFYSADDLGVGDERINILFRVGFRCVEVECMDGFELPDMEKFLLKRNLEMKRNFLAERRLAKAKKGIWVTGTPPFGYKMGENGLIIDEDEAFIVRYAFFRQEMGYGYRKIASELQARGLKNRNGGFFRQNTIDKILKRKDFYMGYLNQEGLGRIKGKHTPLLGEDGKVDMSYIASHSDGEKLLKRGVKTGREVIRSI